MLPCGIKLSRRASMASARPPSTPILSHASTTHHLQRQFDTMKIIAFASLFIAGIYAAAVNEQSELIGSNTNDSVPAQATTLDDKFATIEARNWAAGKRGTSLRVRESPMSTIDWRPTIKRPTASSTHKRPSHRPTHRPTQRPTKQPTRTITKPPARTKPPTTKSTYNSTDCMGHFCMSDGYVP
jgi:hypothetical protein